MYDKDSSEETGNQWYDEGRFVLLLFCAGLMLIFMFD